MRLFIEDNETFPAVVVGEGPAPAGFSDLTSIGEWDKRSAYLESSGQMTWPAVRNEMRSILSSSGWEVLTEAERETLCRWCCVPYNVRLAYVGEEQDKSNWELLLWKTLLDRKRKVELMRREMGDDLRRELMTPDQSNRFYRDTMELLSAYEFSSDPAFGEWLSGSEFPTKDYFTEDRKTRLMAIYNS